MPQRNLLDDNEEVEPEVNAEKTSVSLSLQWKNIQDVSQGVEILGPKRD
jgi:hypothetical protein